MNARVPPFPDRDLAEWAKQLYAYLSAQSNVKQRLEPTPILLSHIVDGGRERAAVDGILMYDPIAKAVVVSIDGVFVQLAKVP